MFFHSQQFQLYQLSCTLNIRKANNDNEVQSINDTYPSKPYVATNNIPDDNIDCFKKALICTKIPVEIMWLLKLKHLIPSPELCSPISVEQVLFSEEYRI